MATKETSTAYAFQTPQGGWRVTGSRVSLDSVVWGYWSGLTPEEIVVQFPTLSPEQVYGAIAWYLGNRNEADQYLRKQQEVWNQWRAKSSAAPSEAVSRLRSLAREKATGTS